MKVFNVRRKIKRLLLLIVLFLIFNFNSLNVISNAKIDKQDVKKTKQTIICKKNINNMAYTILKEGNINYIVFKIPKETSKDNKDNKDNKQVPCIERTIQIPKDYYVYKIESYDIDKDSNNELFVALKTGTKDKNIKLYAYRILKDNIQNISFSYKGRHIKYPYYKEDIMFGSNNITVKYLNKNIDISNACFQLVYTEKFFLDKKQFSLKSQDYCTVNGKSLGDRPNLSNDKKIVLLANRSASIFKLQIQNYVQAVAKKYRIPFVILKSVAVCESNLSQFRGGKPLISFDGGIGIMQITPQTKISNINKIAYDPFYNLEIGAQELCAKWNYKYKKIIPRTDNDNRNILENWYFAVWAYNGWSEVNNPNMIPYRTRYGIRNYAYQEKIMDVCGQYYGTKISRFDYKKVFPKKGLPYKNVVYKTPFPYHYGEIGKSVYDKDVRPEIKNLKYNKLNDSITWKFDDKDYGDHQSAYLISVTNKTGAKVLNIQVNNNKNAHMLGGTLKPGVYVASVKLKDRYYLLSNTAKIRFTVIKNEKEDTTINKRTIKSLNKDSDKSIDKIEKNVNNKYENTSNSNEINQSEIIKKQNSQDVPKKENNKEAE